MERKGSHYKLHVIQAQMQTVPDMNLTNVAKNGIFALGMTQAEALQVVQGLTYKNSVKTMTTDGDHTVWQDVYKAEWQGTPLYVKFQKADNYFVISFKEWT